MEECLRNVFGEEIGGVRGTPTPYAQTFILVNLIVVNFFGFLVIEKNASERFWRKLGEIFPTSLPELSKQKFLRSNRGKIQI